LCYMSSDILLQMFYTLFYYLSMPCISHVGKEWHKAIINKWSDSRCEGDDDDGPHDQLPFGLDERGISCSDRNGISAIGPLSVGGRADSRKA